MRGMIVYGYSPCTILRLEQYNCQMFMASLGYVARQSNWDTEEERKTEQKRGGEEREQG